MITPMLNSIRLLVAVSLASSLSGCIIDVLDPVNLMNLAIADDPSSASGSADTAPDVQFMLARETPERYRSRSCEYIEMALAEVPAYQASSTPLIRQAGDARKVAASQVWLEKGCVTANFPGGKIGVNMETIDGRKAALYSMPTAGVVVHRTIPGGSAEQAGIQPGDVIVAVDDLAFTDSVEFRVLVGKAPIGSRLSLKVWRYQSYQNIAVVVGPADAQQVSMLPVAPPGSTSNDAAASSISIQGMSLGKVTPAYAQAVGLSSGHGAWVIDAAKGSSADKAGIRALDVIVEIGGQEVASPQDIVEISSRMRAGYKTNVIVWRNHAKKDVQMVLKND